MRYVVDPCRIIPDSVELTSLTMDTVSDGPETGDKHAEDPGDQVPGDGLITRDSKQSEKDHNGVATVSHADDADDPDYEHCDDDPDDDDDVDSGDSSSSDSDDTSNEYPEFIPAATKSPLHRIMNLQPISSAALVTSVKQEMSSDEEGEWNDDYGETDVSILLGWNKCVHSRIILILLAIYSKSCLQGTL